MSAKSLKSLRSFAINSATQADLFSPDATAEQALRWVLDFFEQRGSDNPLHCEIRWVIDELEIDVEETT